MQLEPQDLFEKLEFDKILELLEKECLGALGKEQIRGLCLEAEKYIIEGKLLEVKELKRCFEDNDSFPIKNYADLGEDLRMLEVEDFVLPEEGLKRINASLFSVREILGFFNAERKEIYPTLYEIVRPVSFDQGLIDAIEKVIDEKGDIRPDASPGLLKIRKAVLARQRELEKQFRSLINQYRSKGWLTDNVESFRNGRRVLSVPAEHKRKIRGIIHDESATGKTAFLEPEPIIEINNDIFDLQTEEKREIYRILKELSATLRPYVPLIASYQSLLVRFDVIRAKARLALQMNGEMPKIKAKPCLGIQMGRHPLLLLKNKNLGKETVPFDLALFGNNRIVVVSGPNAGGKSILMKSVGLLQLMLQAGLLIPVDAISEMGLFEQLFVDIGDQQSLEDDLSTYSSRLENARTFVEKADAQTLVLIDEFGSGTDPKIGGAIAEAVLRELNSTQVFGLITTHYSNLKMFAFKTKGIVNGSMLFDKEQLAPTYQFKVGRPGSSFAFEIAQKSGLSQKILRYARNKTGKNEKAVDELLIDLQREKQELEEQLQLAATREKQLEKLIKNYEALHKDLEYRRLKIKLEAKENALRQAAKGNVEMEQVIREIREAQKLEQAKKLASEARERRKNLAAEVSDLRDEIIQKTAPAKTKKGEIKVGDFVRMKTGGSAGKVETITKNSAVVQMGLMRMTVNLRDLQHANEPLKVTSKSVRMDTISQNSQFESKLDIRGMRMEEALKIVEDFVDRAFITSSSDLRIVHGKGNGTLRKAVLMKLREYDGIKSIRHPEPEQGGDGVTLVEIK